MSAPPPPPPSSRSGGGGGLSLYADLLDPPSDAAAASISRAPVVSREALDAAKEQDAAAAKKPVDAALRFQPFQPIRRPQQKTQQKPKVGFPKAPPGAATGAPAAAAAAAASAAAAPPKATLADWAATDDDDWMYAGAQRPKGNRKKKKKQRDEAPAETNWDEMYDPSRPTNVDEYLRSDERIREIREWKALLYRHRGPPAKRQASWDSDDDDGGGERPVNNNQFAPPDSYSFAPPPMSPPRASLPDDKTGDDAYARRLAMSQGVAAPAAAAEDPATISRAPVRYEQPEPASPPAAAAGSPEPMDEDRPRDDADADADAPRSNVPGQKHFATRLMQKFGWSKGQGLGADSSGRAEPLRVQVEKRRKRPDAEGGGWAEPAGKGRIIDTSRNKNTDKDNSKFGAMSPVVVLRHMLDNIENLQHEIEEGLGQEIGEECGAQYGRVERLYIDVPGRNVYIKFVDQVSALRAVNALDGRVFAGSTIAPRYYAEDMFERGVYE